MQPGFIDQYSAIESPVRRLDPRVKTLCCFAFMAVVALTPLTAPLAFVIYAGLIGVVVLLSRLPLLFILKRSLVIIPFVAVIGLFNILFKPFSVFLWLMLRAWLSVLAIIVLAATTELPSLLKAFESLGLPTLITSILAFMYRYIFVLVDRVTTLEKARLARSYGRLGFRQMKAMGGILGSLFITTYERGERIYLAMLARGYHGHAHIIRPFQLTLYDVTAAVIFLSFLAASLAYAYLLW
ncbi:MAG: cobalt ECF transporter T component CbiQ [Actinomycetota bacterium]